jgi:leucyl-tRNA synthetase
LGQEGSVTQAPLPAFDEAHLQEDAINYPVSFNGKMRFKLELDANFGKEEVEAAVMAHEKTAQYLEGKSPKRVIVVPKKIVNIVM